tara:strand:- start:1962 stop:3743 length:1782 start_codon:yes stop_codon:yes gene_type:complete
MILKSKFKFLSLIFIFSIISCNEIRQIDRTIKKTFGQVNKFERKKDNYSKKLGINKNNDDSNKSSDENSNYNSFNNIEQKNIINNYGYIFEMINGVDPGKIVNNENTDGPPKVFIVENKDSISISNNLEVFGWHPYWMNDNWKNYPFQLLSTVSFFSYKIDPKTGEPQNPEQLKEWNESSFVETAQDNNTRVLLTVSLHGKNNIIEFFDDEIKREKLYDNVSDLVIEQNADGIDLNFENLPNSHAKAFLDFTVEFKEKLAEEFDKKNMNSPFLSLTLPPSQISESFDIKRLDSHVDLFVIMGYDLHSKDDPGPTSPLQSENSEISLFSIIDRYSKYGLNKNKTLLALPYYGLMYDIESSIDSTNSELKLKPSLETKLTYSEINKVFIENPNLKLNTVLDPISMTKQLSVVFDDYSMKEIFYDDSYTLSKKYAFAISQGLKGVGIWALGFDNNRDELWSLIDESFATDQVVFNDPIAEVNGFPIRFAKSLVKDKYIYFTIIIFLTFSVIIAAIILLNDLKFREKISNSKLNSLILLTILYIFLIPIVIFVKDLIHLDGYGIYLDSEFNLYIAAFLGALFYYLGSKISIKKEERP